MTTTAGPDIIPGEAEYLPALRAADRGVADALESVLSDNTQRVYAAQWRFVPRLVRRRGPARPAGRSTDRGPLPGRPGQCRRQRRHPAPGRLRHRQGPPVGRPRIAR